MNRYKLLVLLLFSCMNSQRVEQDITSESEVKITNLSTVTVAPDEILEMPRGVPLLTNFIDPADGSLKDKLTISKNFSGKLYIAALNISSLKDKFVTVRFKLGRERESIDVPATINRSDIAVPQINLDYFVLDFSKVPFNNVRLLYNLFDYNEYDANEPNLNIVPPSDEGLFCRGLHLVDDPTFKATKEYKCKSGSDVCKYTYAKIRDIGLYDKKNERFVVPKETQIIKDSKDYLLNNSSVFINKCLPDDNLASSMIKLFSASTPNIKDGALSNDYDMINISSALNGYTYKGMFQNINTKEWGITDSAIYSQNGIYQYNEGGINYGSYLYPRFTKMSIRSGVDYLGSYYPFTSKSLDRLTTSGNSMYMNGCNARVATFNDFSHENVSSCNVTASIQILAKGVGEDDIVYADSKVLKLQLIIPSTKNDYDEETEFVSLNSCTSNSECSYNQCCYNNKCWSKNLVSKCLDESKPNLFLSVGDRCSSDNQCVTMCCDRRSGRCADHNPYDITAPTYCQKDAGDTCLTKLFCRQEPVLNCGIYRLGNNLDGSPICGRRCFYELKHGECVGGYCTSALKNAIPSINIENPCALEDGVELKELPVNA